MHGQNLVWLFGNGQPHRSHQILSGEFGKNAWAKYGVICAARLAFQKRQPRRSHQIRNNFAIAKQTKLLLSQQGACSSRAASSGAIWLQLHENKFARIWTNLAKNCAKNAEVSRIRTNFARYHTRSGPLTATVARFCDVCRPPMWGPYKSLVEICKGPHIGGAQCSSKCSRCSAPRGSASLNDNGKF